MKVEVQLSKEEVSAAATQAVAAVLADQIDDVRLFSTARAAELLDISESAFRQLARAEKIRPVRLGVRITRWRLEDIRRLAKS